MTTLSLCMIVKNEEKNLPKCLEHIKDVVDEIIVVDTGSTDRTIEIAKQCGAKVYYFRWCDDFSAARNESLKYATCDYILWLDADDRIEQPDIEKLIKLKENLPKDKKAAFAFKIVSIYPDKEESAYQIRIFPNLSQVRFRGKVHEDISLDIQKMGITPVFVDIKVIHQGYINPLVNKKKAERNLRLLWQELKEQPENLHWHYYLGQTYNLLGKREKAKSHLLKVFHQNGQCHQSVYIAAVVNYANILLEEGKPDEAMALLETLYDKFPQDDFVKFVLGQYYVLNKDFEKALNILITVQPEGIDLLIIPVAHKDLRGTYYAYLGMCYEYFGYLRLAEQAYLNALNYFPGNSEILITLGRLYEKANKPKKTIKFLTDALSSDNLTPSKKAIILGKLGLCYLKMNQKNKAEEMFKKALMYDPQNSDLRVNLAMLYLEKMQDDQAIALLKQALDGSKFIGKNKTKIYLVLAFAYAGSLAIEECVYVADQLLKELDLKSNLILKDMNDLIDVFTMLGEELKQRSWMEEAKLAFNIGLELAYKYNALTEHLNKKADILSSEGLMEQK
ncbi:MAG: glycosyltransferase [Candidatus Desulfofervidaceae bacterium]|nr:glycosyltransferase [Candidatus Desulfofervidaceae bacterium]